MFKPIFDRVPHKLHKLALGSQVAALCEPDETDADDVPEMSVGGICCHKKYMQF